MLELWGRSNAYNVQKVLWMLAELKLDYRHYEVGGNAGELETDDFLALNTHARIPTIRDTGNVVWESNTILRYLAASYGGAALWPQEPLSRSLAERWMDWELCKLQPDFIDLFWGFYRTPAAARDARAIEAAARRCAAHFELLDRHLQSQPYLAGDDFSLGDISCAVCLYRYFEMGFAVPRPRYLMQWYRRLCRRDAYRKVVMTAFSELEGRLEF